METCKLKALFFQTNSKVLKNLFFDCKSPTFWMLDPISNVKNNSENFCGQAARSALVVRDVPVIAHFSLRSASVLAPIWPVTKTNMNQPYLKFGNLIVFANVHRFIVVWNNPWFDHIPHDRKKSSTSLKKTLMKSRPVSAINFIKYLPELVQKCLEVPIWATWSTPL